MIVKPILRAALVAGAALLGACATSPTPVLDSHFGVAVNRAKAQQTINPEAGKKADPVAGIDGTSAVDSLGRYHDSFKAPPPTFNVIEITGAGGGSR